MSRSRDSFITKNKLPDTYFVLLPKELLELLHKYYFGPLEFRIINHAPYVDMFTLKYFDSNDIVATTIYLNFTLPFFFTFKFNSTILSSIRK